MSLRRRLTLVLCAVLLLPLLTVALLVGVGVPQYATDAADTRLTTTARAAAASLAARCASLGELARVLALETTPALGTEPDLQVAQAAVDVVTGTQPGTSATVLGPGGVLASAGPAGDLTSAAGMSCAGGDLAFAAGDPWLVQSVPVRGVASPATVVVVSRLDDDALRAVKADLGLAGDLVVVADGRALATTVEDDGLADRLASAVGASVPVVPVDLAGQRVVADPGGRGLGLRVLAVERVSDTPALIGGVMALLAVAAIVAVGTVVVLARRLTAPLAELTDVAGRLGGGDLQARTPVRGHDEVGRLGEAFNAMADGLVDAIVSARQGREALDESFQHFGRVLGRTHDLDGLVVTLLEASRAASGATSGGAWLGNGRGELRRVAGGGPHGDVMADLARDAVRDRVPASRMLDREGSEVLAHPLLHEDEVLGSVVVAAPAGETFSPEARAALLALSQQAGTAVHNVQTHRETQRLSVTDPLTGAGNFRHLSTTLAREVERASRFDRPLSMLMLDLDHFKSVNDTWGHARGDTVLRELARRLGECVREVDTVARYGGEEFALVLPETDVEGAERVAQRVVDSVGREPFAAADGPPITVTVSVGLATFPLHAHSAGDVMRASDRALYVAKRSGRDQWQTWAPDAEQDAELHDGPDDEGDADPTGGTQPAAR